MLRNKTKIIFSDFVVFLEYTCRGRASLCIFHRWHNILCRKILLQCVPLIQNHTDYAQFFDVAFYFFFSIILFCFRSLVCFTRLSQLKAALEATSSVAVDDAERKAVRATLDRAERELVCICFKIKFLDCILFFPSHWFSGGRMCILMIFVLVNIQRFIHTFTYCSA